MAEKSENGSISNLSTKVWNGERSLESIERGAEDRYNLFLSRLDSENTGLAHTALTETSRFDESVVAGAFGFMKDADGNMLNLEELQRSAMAKLRDRAANFAKLSDEDMAALTQEEKRALAVFALQRRSEVGPPFGADVVAI